MKKNANPTENFFIPPKNTIWIFVLCFVDSDEGYPLEVLSIVVVPHTILHILPVEVTCLLGCRVFISQLVGKESKVGHSNTTGVDLTFLGPSPTS